MGFCKLDSYVKIDQITVLPIFEKRFYVIFAITIILCSLITLTYLSSIGQSYENIWYDRVMLRSELRMDLM